MNDAGMACFAEAIAALEQFMERRTEDPLGNADDHLDRAAARARLLASYIEQRADALPDADNVVQLDTSGESVQDIEDIEVEGPDAADDDDFGADLDDSEPASSVSMELEDKEADELREVRTAEPEPAAAPKPVMAVKGGKPWRDALKAWVARTRTSTRSWWIASSRRRASTSANSVTRPRYLPMSWTTRSTSSIFARSSTP